MFQQYACALPTRGLSAHPQERSKRVWLPPKGSTREPCVDIIACTSPLTHAFSLSPSLIRSLGIIWITICCCIHLATCSQVWECDYSTNANGVSMSLVSRSLLPFSF